MPVKMSFVNSTGAFNAAVGLGPHIITCSWGSSTNGPLSAADQVLAAAIAAAVASGIIVIFSAGNGHAGFPGQHPDVISAGGVFMNPDETLQASNYASGFLSQIYPGRQCPDVCGLVGMKPKAIYIMLPVEPGDDIDRLHGTLGPQGGTHPNGDETANNDGWGAIQRHLRGCSATCRGRGPHQASLSRPHTCASSEHHDENRARRNDRELPTGAGRSGRWTCGHGWAGPGNRARPGGRAQGSHGGEGPMSRPESTFRSDRQSLGRVASVSRSRCRFRPILLAITPVQPIVGPITADHRSDHSGTADHRSDSADQWSDHSGSADRSNQADHADRQPIGPIAPIVNPGPSSALRQRRRDQARRARGPSQSSLSLRMLKH